MENVSMNAAPAMAKSKARKSTKVAALKAKQTKKAVVAKAKKKPVKAKAVAPKVEAPAVVAPVVEAPKAEAPKVARHMQRFMESTGGIQQDYYQWAKEVGRRMHTNKLDALVCAQVGVYAIGHLAYRPTQIPLGMEEGDVADYMLANSVNPFELAMMWKRAKADAETWVSKESILNEWLTGMRKEDFERWGDKNHADSISKRWWNKEAAALDVVLLEINSMEMLGAEITPQDAIDFVSTRKPGKFVNPAQERVTDIEERFKLVTTFRLKDYYVEHLIKSCSSPDAAVLADDDLPF